ncbi:MAG: ATP-binding protein [Rickettsiales bacterium]|jgi:predicted AAA+ superfamily ATPase|nr:ATP-binding protein [Rickettsiales bacterium]
MKLKRLAYNSLLEWKNKKNRKPLILYGARQVGKTWLLKEFAKNEYKTMIYINFDKEPDVHKYFAGNISPEYIIAGLEDYSKKKIIPEDTLIIFDEIQENQRAKDSLKYFNEDAPQYHIAAAGSFLGIAGGKFPVGQVDEITMRPLSFYEFLMATENDILLKNLKTLDKKFLEISSVTAEQRLKEYMYVGGMPAAVKMFIESGNLHETRKIQNEILNNYKEDFSKHIKGTDIPKVRMLWESIPLHLAKEKKKFMYKEIKTGARAAAYENAMDWLVNTGLVYKVCRTSEIKLPISAYADRDAFKILMHDTGLLSAAANLDITTFYDPNPLVFKEFKGAITEQFVLQELKTLDAVPVFYWGRDEGKSEVDFIVQYKNEIVPVEVKSGIRTKSKSLEIYCELYKPKYAVRTTLKGFGIKDNLYSIPLYMIASLVDVFSFEK